MRNLSKKSISLVLIFTLLIAIFVPTMVSAATTETQGNKIINTATSETLTFKGREHNSTIYVGEIKKDGVTVLNYLYSDDVTRSPILFNNLRTALSSPYKNIVPNITTEEVELGLKELSVSTLNGVDLSTIASDWTNASNIATQIYNGKNVDVVNSNMYDVDNSFKSAIDSDESEFASLDDPIARNKRIISHIGTQKTDEIAFKVIDGQLYEIHNVNNIYLSEAITITYTSVNVTTEKTPITSANVTLTAPKVGDKVEKITKNDGYGDYDAQSLQPIVTTSTEGLDVNGFWVCGLGDSSEESFYGTFEEDTYYYAMIDFEAQEGYELPSTFPDGIKINGVVPDEVFAVMGGRWNHCIVKIKATTTEEETKQKVYTINSSTNSGDSISFKEQEGIVYSFYIKDRLATTDEELQQIVELFNDPEYTFESLKEQLNKLIGYGKSAAGDGTLLKLYEVYLYDNGVEINKVEGGFKLKLKMNDDMKGYDSYKLVYIADEGTTEKAIELTKDGEYLEGTLPHLSMYALVGSKTEEKTSTSNNPKTGDNIVIWISLMMVSMLGVAGTEKFVKKNK